MGQLDHPERYGSKRLAVYTNSVGPYFLLDGARECLLSPALRRAYSTRSPAST